MRVCIYKHEYVMNEDVYECIIKHEHEYCMNMCVSMYIYTYMQACTYVHVCVYVCMYEYVFVCIK
jgi:hypothetical protein